MQYRFAMRIATWNVNSIRTREKRLLAWLKEWSPDVLCLQETKVIDSVFPFEAITAAGYHFVVHGQKTYNGVALLSKIEAKDVESGFGDDEDDPQARFIAAKFGDLVVASAYIPNGSKLDSDKYPYKRRWLARLAQWAEGKVSAGASLAIGGDYNIALDERDFADPDRWAGGVLYNADVHADYARILEAGLKDAYRLKVEEGGHFSWWDYRQLSFPRNDGLRIDHILVTEDLAARCRDATIDRDQRKKGACPDGSTASDHAPVVVDFD
ncbi:MAG: exodeoxyribonuclease III [Planctomycetota bacterium]